MVVVMAVLLDELTVTMKVLKTVFWKVLLLVVLMALKRAENSV